MKKTLDLRSDTVTRPTAAMKEAMMQAPVGDDVFGEDPGVNELEKFASELFGMGGALFCPSGTMTNQIAIRVHCRPGDEVICDKLSHIYHYEGGGIAYNSGASVRLLNGDHGRFTAEDVAANINNPEDIHLPLSRMVSTENTCNKGGGSIWSFDQVLPIAALCHQNGLAFHLDGARLFNALVETKEKPEDYGKVFDSISICLSKGLGAPIGSLLLGDEAFIKKSRRVRKVMGGGMRQAGSIAAAGLYALQNHVGRLKEDHKNARLLSEIIGESPIISEILPVETNIVVARIHPGMDTTKLLAMLKENGILAVGFGVGAIRFVTHLDFNSNDLNDFKERWNRTIAVL